MKSYCEQSHPFIKAIETKLGHRIFFIYRLSLYGEGNGITKYHDIFSWYYGNVFKKNYAALRRSCCYTAQDNPHTAQEHCSCSHDSIRLYVSSYTNSSDGGISFSILTSLLVKNYSLPLVHWNAFKYLDPYMENNKQQYNIFGTRTVSMA